MATPPSPLTTSPWPSPVAWLGLFKTTRALALAIGAICVVGIAYGFYYYAPQFAATRTAPWLWPFVPDSPLAVLWGFLALAAYWMGRRPGILDALAFVGNVQVGLWTVYVLLAYAESFGTYTLNLNTILLAAHAGMAALALIFVHGLRQERAPNPRRFRFALAGALAYYAVNDALDYGGPTYSTAPRGPAHECLDYGLRPWTVPCKDGAETALALVTVGLTLASVAVLWWATRAPRAE